MFPRLLRRAPDLKPFKIDPDRPVILRSFQAGERTDAPAAPLPDDYRPPSLLARHRVLLLVFVLACAAVIAGLIRAFHHPRPPPAEPVYIESVGPTAPADGGR